MNIRDISPTNLKRINLSNDGISINVAKDPISLCFDRIIPTANGFVTGVKMNAIHPATTCNAMVNATINKSFDINQLHKVFGHCAFGTLRCTAKIYNLTIFGNVEVCEDHAIAKAKQKSVSKVWLGSSNIPEERIYTDISLIKGRSFMWC
jgi:hypothetical protein